MRLLFAIEMMEAAQAIDLRRPKRMGRVAQTLYDLVRSTVPALEEDRPLGPEAERVAATVTAYLAQEGHF